MISHFFDKHADARALDCVRNTELNEDARALTRSCIISVDAFSCFLVNTFSYNTSVRVWCSRFLSDISLTEL